MSQDELALGLLGDVVKAAVDGWWGSNDPRPTLDEAIVAAVVDDPRVVLAALGMTAVAMSDTDCGWVVSASVEAAGAWSTAPEGGWARDDG